MIFPEHPSMPELLEKLRRRQTHFVTDIA